MKKLFLLFSVIASQVAFSAVPQKLSQLPDGDRMIYARLLQAYRKGELAEVIKQRELMAKHYSNSVFLDRAYYMNGLLELQNNRIGEALKNFDVVTDKFVLSNKRPSALFAMASAYRTLKLKKEANGILKKIMKEYPNSPESRRAWMQLRLDKKS